MKRFLKASDSGFPQAACGIAILYEEGHGVEQDYNKAMEWYIKANDGGDHCATYNIGLMYHDGHGVEQDTVADKTEQMFGIFFFSLLPRMQECFN